MLDWDENMFMQKKALLCPKDYYSQNASNMQANMQLVKTGNIINIVIKMGPKLSWIYALIFNNIKQTKP